VAARHRCHEKEITMNARLTWVFGLAGLGLVAAIPVQAAPAFMDGGFIVARRDRGDEDRRQQRDVRQDDRREPRRDAGRDESQGYGYGYERRQQQQFEQDSRQRGRR
jgi:hypothetical protein